MSHGQVLQGFSNMIPVLLQRDNKINLTIL